MSNENTQQKPLTDEEMKQLRVLSINNIMASNKYIVIGENKIEVAGFTSVEARAKLQQAVFSMENQVITTMVNDTIVAIMTAAAREQEALPVEAATVKEV